jgi:hypothetical protein
MIVDYLGGNLFLFIDVILGRRRSIEESRSLWMLGRGLRWYEIRGLGLPSALWWLRRSHCDVVLTGIVD